jgi:hypothetical protein
MQTLDKGDFFGEANVIFNLQDRKLATVLAASICKVGVIDEV